jgi:hypothetical protein
VRKGNKLGNILWDFSIYGENKEENFSKKSKEVFHFFC